MAKAPVKAGVKEDLILETEKTTAQEPDAAKKTSTVKVKNLTKSRFVQPGTKITIYGGQEMPMANDGWLNNQIAAGFLVIVK